MSNESLSQNESLAKKRSVWFHLHFWIGWIAAIPIFLVCFTGGVLIFEQDIFRWEHKELFQLDTSGERLSVQGVLDAYASANPPLRVNHLGLPKSPEYSYSAYCTEIRPEGNRGAGRVFLNPYTGELSRLGEEFSWAELLISVHRRLAAGQTGRLVVAISSLLLAFSSVVGLILWWPLRGRTFARALKRGQAFDWHNALGLLTLVPLFIMSITGVMITWGRDIWPIVDTIQGYSSQATPPALVVTEGKERASMDEIVAYTRAEAPGKRITGLQPGSGKNAVKVFLDADGNKLQLYFDPCTGKEIGRFDGSGTGPVGAFRKFFGTLHTFYPYHITLRILWGVCSIVGSALVVTGIWISVKRWRRRAS